MRWIYWILIFVECSLSLCFLALGLYDILHGSEINGCAMTYMYEYPEYLKVPMPSEVYEQFPKYNLYIYGEGHYAGNLKLVNGQLKLSGIPVVFVHGNAGSYKQVRSLGSVSLRKSDYSKYHFNYFSVDFSEELSALYGGFLPRQVRFLHHALKSIRQCYDHLRERPSGVVAVGHSMGGLVIRALYTLPDFDPGLVHTVFTLATPHQQPPFMFDSKLSEFYHNLNSFSSSRSTPSLANVSFVSLGGGFRDFQVRVDATSLVGISGVPSHVCKATTAVPLVWLSTDHLCIVWCNQLVRAITRSLFDMIDPKTHQVFVDPVRRQEAVDYHFRGRPGISNSLSSYSSSRLSMPKKCQAIVASSLAFRHDVSFDASCFVLPLDAIEADCDGIDILVDSLNQKVLGACKEVRDGSCEGLVDVNFLLETLPGRSKPFRFASIAYRQRFSSFRALALNLSPRDRCYIRCSSNLRTYTISLARWFVPGHWASNDSLFIDFSATFVTKFSIPGLTEPWQVVRLDLSLKNCSGIRNGAGMDGIVAQFRVPWFSEQQNFSSTGRTLSIELKIMHAKPVAGFAKDHIQVYVWHDLSCGVDLHVRYPFRARIGQLLRYSFEELARFYMVTSVLVALWLAMYGNVTAEGDMMQLLLPCGKVMAASVCVVLLRTAYSVIVDKQLLAYAGERLVIPLLFSALLAAGLNSVCRVILLLLMSLAGIFTKRAQQAICRGIPAALGLTARSMPSVLLCACAALGCYWLGPGLVLLFIDLAHFWLASAVLSGTHRGFHAALIAALLPSVLLTIPETAVMVSDVASGRTVERSAHKDCYLLVVCYLLFLLRRPCAILGSRYASCCSAAGVGAKSILLLAFFCAFPEFVNLYNISYLSSYFLLVLLLLQHP